MAAHEYVNDRRSGWIVEVVDPAPSEHRFTESPVTAPEIETLPDRVGYFKYALLPV